MAARSQNTGAYLPAAGRAPAGRDKLCPCEFESHLPGIIAGNELKKIKGDMRILGLLIQKDAEATKNIGEPSPLMGVYHIDAEQAKTASALEQGQSAEEFETRHKKKIQLYFDEQNIAETLKKRRKDERDREVESLFAEYMEWIEETLSTEDQAFIKVGAVLQG